MEKACECAGKNNLRIDYGRETYSFSEILGMKHIYTFFCLFLLSGVVIAGNQTYEDVVAGKSCKVSDSQQINCDYFVGTNLHVGLAGVGVPDTAIYFMYSDFNSDYYAKVGIMHGCVIISPGRASDRLPGGNLAFISPRNGKVYEDWKSCKAGY